MKKVTSHQPLTPFPTAQPVGLDPRSLLLAYRRAHQARRRGVGAGSVAQAQFVTALQKLRARVTVRAPILRSSGLDGVAIPHVDDGSAGPLSQWLREVFWRRQRIFNEAVAAVINHWPHHSCSSSAEVWLRDEIRPHIRSYPAPGSTHREGLVTSGLVWGAKAAVTSTLLVANWKAIETVHELNALFFEALEVLVSTAELEDARIESLAARLAALAAPGALRLPSRFGFREQERFLREAALALSAILLPGEAVLDSVYASWRTAEDARTSPALEASVQKPVSFVFAGEGLSDRAVASLECQPGAWEVFTQGTQGSTLRHIAARAAGDWVALVTENVSFAPNLLESLDHAARESPSVALFYSDHDEHSDAGGFARPFFKPGWSPELHVEADYIGGVLFVRRELFEEWAQSVEGLTATSLFSFLLQAHTDEHEIARIPRVLWHRLGNAPVPDATAAIQTWARTQGEEVRVSPAPTGRRVKWALKGQPLVSIIVPFKDKPELLEQLVTSFEKYETYSNVEFILVSNNSTNGATFRLLSSLKSARYHVHEWNHPFNYQSINNWAVRSCARGSHLLFLNNDISWGAPGVLEEMLGHSQRKEIGAVGVNLRFPRGRLQHAGVALGVAGFAAHPFAGVRPDAKWTAYGLPSWTRNYLAVTGACLMMRRNTFDEVKGFDEAIVVSGGDVDLCLRVHTRGYRIVNTPHVKVTHHESATRSGLAIPDSDAWQCFQSFYPYLKGGDPYYNPNLTLTSQDVLPRLDRRTAEELAMQLLSVELASSRQLLA